MRNLIIALFIFVCVLFVSLCHGGCGPNYVCKPIPVESAGIRVVDILSQEVGVSGSYKGGDLAIKIKNVSENARKIELQKIAFRYGPDPLKMYDILPGKTLSISGLDSDNVLVIRNKDGGRIGIIRIESFPYKK